MQECTKLVDVMAVDINGVTEMQVPQGDTGSWQSVQPDAALVPAEVGNAAARFAPGTKFVVSTA